MKKIIDGEAPLASLLAAGELSGAELARRMRISQSVIPPALRRGSKVSLDWLARAADAAGFRLEIGLKKKEAYPLDL